MALAFASSISSCHPCFSSISTRAFGPVFRSRAIPSLHVKFTESRSNKSWNPVLRSARVSLARAAADEMVGGGEEEEKKEEAKESNEGMKTLNLISELQVLRKAAKKERRRRKRLLQKRRLRKKGRWPPSKMKKNSKV